MTGKQRRFVVCLVACLAACLASSTLALAQEQGNTTATALVRVLQAKGILSAEDVAQVTQASSSVDADQRLAKLLITKGVISQADYDQIIRSAAVVSVSAPAPDGVRTVPAIYHVP